MHTATLKANNQRVAIKVQHPRLAETLPIDMWLLRGVASLSRLNSTLKELRIDETVDQFATNFMLQVTMACYLLSYWPLLRYCYSL